MNRRATAGFRRFPWKVPTNTKGDRPIIHHQEQPTALDPIVELLAESGFDGLAQAVTVLLDEVMKIERAAVLKATHLQRTDDRQGYANGFMPRTLLTRLGALTVEMPQTRGVEFYPSALEKGVRSERALKLAVAEMYVQGVSTRKAAAITERLCGLEVTSAAYRGMASAENERLARSGKFFTFRTAN